MSRTLFLPLAVITAVLLAGCGGTFSGTETQAEEEGSYSGEVLSTEETCTQLRDVGGTELIEKVDAFAVEVTDKNGNVVWVNNCYGGNVARIDISTLTVTHIPTPDPQ